MASLLSTKTLSCSSTRARFWASREYKEGSVKSVLVSVLAVTLKVVDRVNPHLSTPNAKQSDQSLLVKKVYKRFSATNLAPLLNTNRLFREAFLAAHVHLTKTKQFQPSI
jgi:hypothetical protein